MSDSSSQESEKSPKDSMNSIQANYQELLSWKPTSKKERQREYISVECKQLRHTAIRTNFQGHLKSKWGEGILSILKRQLNADSSTGCTTSPFCVKTNNKTDNNLIEERTSMLIVLSIEKPFLKFGEGSRKSYSF